MGCDLQIEDSMSNISSEEESSTGLMSPVSSLESDIMEIDMVLEPPRTLGNMNIPMIVVSHAIDNVVHSQDEADVAAALMGMRNLRA